MNTHTISEEIIRTFHLFWDNFPFPVMLLHKDRTIIDRNKAAETAGFPVGTRCADMGEKEYHRGCQANVALKKGTAMRDVSFFEPANAVLDSYWVPLAGNDELYVHFSIDISPYAAEHMFPKKCDGAGRECSSCNCG